MFSDLLSILLWWAILFIIGIINYPLTRRIFHRFIDHGYLFSKVLGILILSYTSWILGVVKIVPFYQESLILILLIMALINLYILKKSFTSQTKPSIKLPTLTFIILEEILFLIAFAFWSYIRANEPPIHGLEKFMDFGFIESILRAKYFPPLDMWLAKSPAYDGGYFINYYYFGHLIAAVLTKLSTLSAAITYNLMIALSFAFTFCLSFSLGTNLVFIFLKIKDKAGKFINLRYAIVGGFLAAFIVALGGNLHTVYSFTTGYPNENPVPFWQIPFGFNPQTYWYPNATRFIPYTIHEFPIYSFVVADLHGHVSDIPFVLLLLALLFNLLISSASPSRSPSGHLEGDPKGLLPGELLKTGKALSHFLHEFHDRTSISLPYLFLIGWIISIMYMTNALDGLIYLILAGVFILYINYDRTRSLIQTIVKTFSASLFLLFFFLILNLPFSLFFKPFGTGIGVLCAPNFLLGKHFGPLLFEEGKCQKSNWWMLMILWGFFYYNLISYLILIIIPQLKRRLTTGNIQIAIPDIFVILTTIISTLLLIFPEFFYVKDIYPMHYRANTMFKLGYQAFIMLGINSAYIFIRIKNIPKNIGKYIYFIIFSVLFFLIAIYPFFAINSYYGSLRIYHGLDGLQWLQQEYLDDYQAILWLRKNIAGQPVILEANGESYTDFARVSSYTGLPTVIGWPVHEWLWRGSYDEAGRRIPEVQSLYESSDLTQTKELLDKYKIEYVFVGTLELQKYPNLDENKWNNLGEKVFQSGNTKIYKIN